VAPVTGFDTVHRQPRKGGPQRSRHDDQEVGTFLATQGDLHGHPWGPQLATSGDFLMATDTAAWVCCDGYEFPY
jgi:hypothetical protein